MRVCVYGRVVREWERVGESGREWGCMYVCMYVCGYPLTRYILKSLELQYEHIRRRPDVHLLDRG
jgi:hypothetical protein